MINLKFGGGGGGGGRGGGGYPLTDFPNPLKIANYHSDVQMYIFVAMWSQTQATRSSLRN